MEQVRQPGAAFRVMTLITVAVGAILVWWGAAVTTRDVGLAVPDWPLSFGSLNPKGWLGIPAFRLEHGHRLLAAGVGLLVLAMYFWIFTKEKPRLVEAVGLVLSGVGYLFLIRTGHLRLGSAFVVWGLIWWGMTWAAQRWTLARAMTTFALMLVIVQASLGGLRVLEMSDPFGIVHGTLGQLFFCVLVLIAIVSSRGWRESGWTNPGIGLRMARGVTTLLFSAVFLQLVVGAVLRHTQRVHLVAHDLLTTAGYGVPPVSEVDAFVLFLHKAWGCVVALLVLMVAVWSRRWLAPKSVVGWLPWVLMLLPLVQVALGVAVIQTGSSFWVTNFHVINGLALLTLSFMLMVITWRGSGALVEASPEGDASASAV